MTRLLLAALLLLASTHARPDVAGAEVLSGEFDEQVESTYPPFAWGDGINDLLQQFSSATPSSIWVYGLDYSHSPHPTSNADVARVPGTDLVIRSFDATNLDYTSGPLQVFEGDTVFFRGANGYYGAWRLLRVDLTGNNHWPFSTLDAVWYFQTDGTGLFEGVPIETEAPTWSQMKTLYSE